MPLISEEPQIPESAQGPRVTPAAGRTAPTPRRTARRPCCPWRRRPRRPRSCLIPPRGPAPRHLDFPRRPHGPP
ncbi:hypothetical protein DTB58_08555 [Streptomyces griseus]|nr:hypothetical protein [Streptomyces griseus]